MYGEDKFVIMFGGLHIEMAAFKVHGKWLEASGWTHALTYANVASSSTADCFLKASNVNKTRRAHQITACSLYILLQAAYKEYALECSEGTISDFESWCDRMSTEKTHFQFWYQTLLLELGIFTFIRSIREGNFRLYLASLAKLIPCLFRNESYQLCQVASNSRERYEVVSGPQSFSRSKISRRYFCSSQDKKQIFRTSNRPGS